METGSPKRRESGSSTARNRLNVRVTPEQYEELVAASDGRMTMTEVILARLFRGGVTDRTTLRSIAALHLVGRKLQALADHPSAESDEVAEAVSEARAAISALADQLP